MRSNKFFWKLFLGNALLVGVVLSTCVWLILGAFETFYVGELTLGLKAQATALIPAVRDRLGGDRITQLDALAKEVGSTETQGVRITFIAVDGTVRGDSQANPSDMESHADRAEVIEALAKGWGHSTRWSYTVNRELKYVAVRIGPADNPTGVVRAAMAVQSIGQRTKDASRLTWTIAVVALAAAVLLALGLATLWSKRIQRITEVAQSLARGDLEARVAVRGSDEVALLGRSLNRMRDNITTQLATIDRQRNMLESLVTQLREGVIVAHADGRILLVNPEARRLLGMDVPPTENGVDGLTVEACVPQHELQKLLRTDTSESRSAGPDHHSSRTREISLQLVTPDGRVSLLARAFDINLPEDRATEQTPDDTRRTGRLLVLTDVSDLTKTLQMKTDFAANASHELRTPLSTIRAAVETLQSIDLATDTTAAAQFVEVVARQSARLEEMVSDLLDLARLESPAVTFEPEEVDVAKLLAGIQQDAAEKIRVKDIRFAIEIAVECHQVRVNADLLKIALRNLIDNAVQFTDQGGSVTVDVTRDGDVIETRVIDDGCGIPLDEQDRVFERFYQVARARSGSNRGSGLGLSIVRHAVAAMQGEVRIESVLDEGTTITVSFPS